MVRTLVALLDERLSDQKLERFRVSHAKAIRELQNIVRPMEFRVGKWQPTLTIGGSPIANSDYVARQGRYIYTMGYVFVLLKVKTKSVSASSETVKITGLPFAPSSALNDWPTWTSQCNPTAFGRLTPDEPAMYLNSTRGEIQTSWTFTQILHFNAGVVYEVAV